MKKILIIFILTLSYFVGTAQSKNQLRLEFYTPINPFSAGNFTPNGFHYPSNKGIAIGLEHDYKTKKRRRSYQTLVLGFYNEVYFERVLTLESNYGVNFKLYKGLQAGFEAGLGYNRAQSSNLVSVLEGNKWVSQVDKSVITNRLTGGASINLGYDFSNHFDGKFPLTISAMTGASVVAPYLKEVGAPIGVMRANKIVLKYRF